MTAWVGIMAIAWLAVCILCTTAFVYGKLERTAFYSAVSLAIITVCAGLALFLEAINFL